MNYVFKRISKKAANSLKRLQEKIELKTGKKFSDATIIGKVIKFALKNEKSFILWVRSSQRQ